MHAPVLPGIIPLPCWTAPKRAPVLSRWTLHRFQAVRSVATDSVYKFDMNFLATTCMESLSQ
jgi:hypothetical protein